MSIQATADIQRSRSLRSCMLMSGEGDGTGTGTGRLRLAVKTPEGRGHTRQVCGNDLTFVGSANMVKEAPVSKTPAKYVECASIETPRNASGMRKRDKGRREGARQRKQFGRKELREV